MELGCGQRKEYFIVGVLPGVQQNPLDTRHHILSLHHICTGKLPFIKTIYYILMNIVKWLLY